MALQKFLKNIDFFREFFLSYIVYDFKSKVDLGRVDFWWLGKVKSSRKKTTDLQA